jgi:serine/threonine protein kinase
MKLELEEITSPSMRVYRETSKLGSGNFGCVTKACDQSGKTFALKKLDLKRLQQTKAIEYLVTEQQLMHVIDHPRILKIHEQFRWKNSYILVTTFCDGGDLHKMVFENHQNLGIGEEMTRFYFLQILDAFCELARHRIMHRDLKLANIFLHEKNIVIGDFGLAKMGSTNTDSQVGSLYYIAPEILVGLVNHCNARRYDYKVDVWSLGVCLYAFLFGVLPFLGKDNEELLQNIIKHSGDNLNFPSSVVIGKESKELLRQLLQMNPEDRVSFEELFVTFGIQSSSMVDINTLFVANSSSRSPNFIRDNKNHEKMVNLGLVQGKSDPQSLLKRGSFSYQETHSRISSNKDQSMNSGACDDTLGYLFLANMYSEEDHNSMQKIVYFGNMIIFYMNAGKEVMDSMFIRRFSPDIWDIGLMIFELFLFRKSEICLGELKKALNRQSNVFNISLSHELSNSPDVRYYTEFFMEVEDTIENFYRLSLDIFKKKFPSEVKYYEKYMKLNKAGANSRLKEGTKRLWDFYLEHAAKFSESQHKELLTTIFFLVHATDFQAFFGQAYLQNPFNLVKFHCSVSEKSNAAISEWIRLAYQINPHLLNF